MLFGKDAKPEETDIGHLESLLDSLFDKKIGNLEGKASSIVKDLQRTREEFAKACNKFDELNAEPELENFYFDNANFIKSQKSFYCRALSHLIEEWDLKGEGKRNIYVKYAAISSNTASFLSEVLKSNNKFKKVLYSYSKHIDSFKRLFTATERSNESLKNELSRVSKEISEYDDTIAKIRELTILDDQLAELETGIKEINQIVGSGKPDTDNEESEINGKINQVKSDLSELNSKASELRGRLAILTTPLERPARKFDHLSSRKKQLHPFIIDPIENMKSETDYMEFRSMLEEMGKSIEMGSIEEKNVLKINDTISEALNNNVYSIITHIKSLQQRKSSLEKEEQSLHHMLSQLKESSSAADKAKEDKGTMEGNKAELAGKISSSKLKVEEMLVKYYNQKVTVLLGSKAEE